MSKEDMNHQVLFTDYPDIVNVEQLSAMLGISTKTAYKLLKEEKIKSIHIEGTYRIAKVHVLKYLELSE
ncbi:helix-turn-helix domain-containing protein [uncultured Acetatifactor sp.]|jgi:excisionase family DNA binding protein|uniref:helix-turn-helix domain-containing protein n=1 Tax=uncultured Acetatifactor sp. TaxID=1671927 RepID=UPI0026026280|nr:helix-turn-helix domain-containing protein [uncultured Acetatifactor sp.]